MLGRAEEYREIGNSRNTCFELQGIMRGLAEREQLRKALK